MSLNLYDLNKGSGQDGYVNTIYAASLKWNNTVPSTALFWGADCEAVTFAYYSWGAFRFLRYEMPLDCTDTAD